MAENKLIKLNDSVNWWLDAKAVKVVYSPSTKGVLMPEFAYQFILDERRITETGLAKLMNADFFDLGALFTLEQVRTGIARYVWADYLKHCDYPDYLKALPRVEFVRPVGRPRKDGTSKTIRLKVGR